MPRKRFKTEEIIQKLREAEVLLSQGTATCVEKPRDLRALSAKYITDTSRGPKQRVLRAFLPRFTTFDGDETWQASGRWHRR